MDRYGLDLEGWELEPLAPAALAARPEGEVRERGLVLSDASAVPHGLLCPKVFGAGSEHVGWIALARPIVNLWMVPALLDATGLALRDVEALYYHHAHLGPVGVVHEGSEVEGLTGASALRQLAATQDDRSLDAIVWDTLPVLPPRLRPERGQEGRTPSRLYRKVLHHVDELRAKSKSGAARVLLEDERARLQAAASDALTWGVAQGLASFATPPKDLVRRTTYFVFARLDGAPDDTTGADRPGTMALWLARVDETRRRIREAAIEVRADAEREAKLARVLRTIGLAARLVG